MKQATKQRPKLESTLGALVAHPTRVAAYVILTERVASPNEIAKEIGLNVRHVGYHVRKLKEYEVVELVDEQPRRGAVEHFYRATKRPYLSDEEFLDLSPEQRDDLTRYTLQLHVTDVARAVDAGTFDARPNRSLVRLPLNVDDDGFAELADLERECYERRLEIQAKSASRIATEGAEPIPTVATSMFFEVPVRAKIKGS